MRRCAPTSLMARRPDPARTSSARTRPAEPGALKPAPKRPGPGKPVSAKVAIARIHAAIRAIPAGRVAGYGVIAQRAGLPGRARLVARVLSNNDDPSLPWHRVLRSDGRIAFPPDSAGHAEQTQRLRAEGVAVESGRVLGMRRTRDSLDALVWAPPRR